MPPIPTNKKTGKQKKEKELPVRLILRALVSTVIVLVVELTFLRQYSPFLAKVLLVWLLASNIVTIFEIVRLKTKIKWLKGHTWNKTVENFHSLTGLLLIGLFVYICVYIPISRVTHSGSSGHDGTTAITPPSSANSTAVAPSTSNSTHWWMFWNSKIFWARALLITGVALIASFTLWFAVNAAKKIRGQEKKNNTGTGTSADAQPPKADKTATDDKSAKADAKADKGKDKDKKKEEEVTFVRSVWNNIVGALGILVVIVIWCFIVVVAFAIGRPVYSLVMHARNAPQRESGAVYQGRDRRVLSQGLAGLGVETGVLEFHLAPDDPGTPKIEVYQAVVTSRVPLKIAAYYPNNVVGRPDRLELEGGRYQLHKLQYGFGTVVTNVTARGGYTLLPDPVVDGQLVGNFKDDRDNFVGTLIYKSNVSP